MATLFGDTSGTLSDSQSGGSQSLAGTANQDNTLHGDAASIIGSASGGDDSLTGGGNTGGENITNVLFGEAVSMSANSQGGNDIVLGDSNSGSGVVMNFLYGEALSMTDSATGGDDIVTGGSNSGNQGVGNTVYGDASLLSGAAIGGDDVITGGSNTGWSAENILAGDAFSMTGTTKGGNDRLIGGANAGNTMYGDAQETMLSETTAGDDELIGGAGGKNELIGDAFRLEFIRGGDDRLTGGNNSINLLMGDARVLHGALGGNDVLIGAAGGMNYLFGDGEMLEASARGGNDRLISGPGEDWMYGDAGHPLDHTSVGGRDVFVFADDNGNDIIFHFERGRDLIDVSAVPGVAHGLLFASNASATFDRAASDLEIEEIGRSTFIHLDDGNTVTVFDVTGLSETDFITTSGSSYVLFGRTSAAIGARDRWLGSEANNQASNTPGNVFRGSAFNADTATAGGTVLAGAGLADYAADGILINANVAMFNLTETPTGVFATAAPADLDGKIASNTKLFGAADTDLDPSQSDVDLSLGKLHLAQTDQDWNGIKNLEVSLDSATSLRDIHLQDFVDMRVKLGNSPPIPGAPQGEVFDVQLVGAKRGEVNASRAPQSIDLVVAPWTNDGTSQNSFDIKGSIFNDTVTVLPDQVFGSRFGQSENWYSGGFSGPGSEGVYLGRFTTVFANLGTGSDQFDSQVALGFGNRDGGPFFASRDTVWGSNGDDVIVTGHGADRLFGDNGSGAWFNPDPFSAVMIAGNDHLDAGAGADWIEGNGDTGVVVLKQINVITNGSFEEFDRTPGPEVISHDGGKWFTLNEFHVEPDQVDNLPGWESFNGAIELQTNAIGGLAFAGQIKLELDSHPDFGQSSFTFLSQSLPLEIGVSYHLSFAYAPRAGAPPGSSAFDFSFSNFIDGDPGNFAASFANDEPGWHVFEADIIGTGAGQLNFSPSGTLDTLGALIDDVRVTQEPTLDLSLAGDIIDCGVVSTDQPRIVPDFDRDTVNFNAGDGFDVVSSFRPGSDVLRMANVGALTTDVVFSDQGHGTLVQNGAGAVFLLGVTTPLGQTTDGGYLLLS